MAEKLGQPCSDTASFGKQPSLIELNPETGTMRKQDEVLADKLWKQLGRIVESELTRPTLYERYESERRKRLSEKAPKRVMRQSGLAKKKNRQKPGACF